MGKYTTVRKQGPLENKNVLLVVIKDLMCAEAVNVKPDTRIVQISHG